ncbi:ABC transporter G family member STR2-like [Vicia villosa]|uniref:ABC transporter G family member STR2-like n=1 Tax=Vicia villosa TaxID=3911 RepID=UPI00273B73C1|nr:ABC transporter G family member STR2-like [Vicia villosa]
MSRPSIMIGDLIPEQNLWKIVVRVVDVWTVKERNGQQHIEAVIQDANWLNNRIGRKNYRQVFSLMVVVMLLLWLSADLSKPEKVLVVERVIEFLGLQSVRNSVVGTVEKRRISGGQRKRVNVGLEMIMEPSLLMLDEPTSGLDSASSQLLLRALRHEALEGVNVCMVVHQPTSQDHCSGADIINGSFNNYKYATVEHCVAQQQTTNIILFYIS